MHYRKATAENRTAAIAGAKFYLKWKWRRRELFCTCIGLFVTLLQFSHFTAQTLSSDLQKSVIPDCWVSWLWEHRLSMFCLSHCIWMLHKNPVILTGGKLCKCVCIVHPKTGCILHLFESCKFTSLFWALEKTKDNACFRAIGNVVKNQSENEKNPKSNSVRKH